MAGVRRLRGVPPGAPGGPPKPKRGRGPGKIPKSVKEMVLESLSDLGGIEYLKQQATDNPHAYLTLVGKVLPLQVTGEGGGPVIIRTGVPRDGD